MSATHTQVINQLLNQVVAGTVRHIVSGFLIDCQARQLSPKTIRAYSQELRYFCDFLDGQGVVGLEELTAEVIRLYLVQLSERRNPGGCHIAYRVIKTFTYWWEQETDGEYRSPIRKVRPPKLNVQPLAPVDLGDVRAMLETCKSVSGAATPTGLATFAGDRDKAIILSLLDSGCRATEFISIDLDDVDLVTGAVYIHQGKGGKSRSVFMGKTTRRAIRAYLKHRQDNCPALWVSLRLQDEGDRLTYSGLRQIVRRRAARAGVPEPGLHAFRRAFCLAMLRAGCDLVTLSRLMGHADLQVLTRYLRQTGDDLQAAHARGSPVDGMGDWLTSSP